MDSVVADALVCRVRRVQRFMGIEIEGLKDGGGIERLKD
jgi:hypothetical protein